MFQEYNTLRSLRRMRIPADKRCFLTADGRCIYPTNTLCDGCVIYHGYQPIFGKKYTYKYRSGLYNG